MRESNIEKTDKVFYAYGHAAYAAQILENGMRLLLLVINNVRKTSKLPPLRVNLDSPETHKTLGTLFREVCISEFITPAEKKIIAKAIKNRNYLIHSYWRDEKNVLAMLKSDGRDWIINDLTGRKKLYRKADEIISSFIDQYLSVSGESIHSLSTPVFEDEWEEDFESEEYVTTN